MSYHIIVQSKKQDVTLFIFSTSRVFCPTASQHETWDFLLRIANSPQQKGPLCVWDSSNWCVCVCVQPHVVHVVHVPEEELSVPPLSSQNTNWIVKAEQLLFGNVVINRASYILCTALAHGHRDSVSLTESSSQWTWNSS